MAEGRGFEPARPAPCRRDSSLEPRGRAPIREHHKDECQPNEWREGSRSSNSRIRIRRQLRSLATRRPLRFAFKAARAAAVNRASNALARTARRFIELRGSRPARTLAVSQNLIRVCGELLILGKSAIRHTHVKPPCWSCQRMVKIFVASFWCPEACRGR